MLHLRYPDTSLKITLKKSISCSREEDIHVRFSPIYDAVLSEEGQLMKCENLKKKLYPTLPGWPICT